MEKIKINPPKWAEVIPVLIYILRSGKPKAKDEAAATLLDVAKLLDAINTQYPDLEIKGIE